MNEREAVMSTERDAHDLEERVRALESTVAVLVSAIERGAADVWALELALRARAEGGT